jgi:hypothetical protein
MTAGNTPDPGRLVSDVDTGLSVDIGEFLDRYGDAIDDRMAEILEDVVAELVAARLRSRQRIWLPLASTLAAVTGISVPLRHTPFALVVLWLTTAAICGCWSVRFRRNDAVGGVHS